MQTPSSLHISRVSGEGLVDCCLDTIKIGKQALVFVNSKRSAEKEAEDISKKTKLGSDVLRSLSEKIRDVLPHPTVQCERLSKCVLAGVAFHHAGLHSKQKSLIESAFRSGIIKIICSTPTLAAGLDLPAFRAIIRDLKRFGQNGMVWIPVLEFLQMAGRCGRPKYDTYGEAVILANTESEKERIIEKYVNGVPEEIFSKLAVEPVLRTYLLSLISVNVIGTNDSIREFFGKTFWAHQFGDMERLYRTIDKQLDLLVNWKFLIKNSNTKKGDVEFVSSNLGERVAQLYLDPWTANEFLSALKKCGEKVSAFVLLHLVCNTLEMRPLLSIRKQDYSITEERCSEEQLLQSEPDMFSEDYDTWLRAGKTAMMLESWISERDEDVLLDEFGTRPGETRNKVDTSDWLLYGLSEIAKVTQFFSVLNEIQKLRLRLQYGVREELLPLVRLEGIGRVRARILFKSNIKTIGDIHTASLITLSQLLGPRIAASLKHQTYSDDGKKEVGQRSLMKYGKREETDKNIE